MITGNPTVFGPGPGQLLWFFAVWSLVHLWFTFVYTSLRKKARRK